MKSIKLSAIIIVAVMVISQIALAAVPFSDHVGHKWENGIEFVYNRGIVQGYPDGTFRPDNTLNRAELLKVIVVSSYSEAAYNVYEGDACFDDVDGSEWYTKYVCFGKAQGIVEGYDDGTFRPENKVNLVEALKIMFVGMDVTLTSSVDSPWYQKYYNTAAAKYLVPDELTGAYTSDFSRAQAAEVIKRVISLDADIINPPLFTSEGGYEPGTVYLGYIKTGSIIDVYVVADTNIDSYEGGSLTIVFEGNTLNSFSEDRNIAASIDGNNVVINSSNTLDAGEILHLGTAYFASEDSVTITAQ